MQKLQYYKMYKKLSQKFELHGIKNLFFEEWLDHKTVKPFH